MHSPQVSWVVRKAFSLYGCDSNRIRWRRAFRRLSRPRHGRIWLGVGLFFLKVVKTAVLSKVLGGFIIVYAIYQLLPAMPLQASRIAAIAWGFFGGAVGALFGTGGPFYVIYFNLRRLEKSVFRATFALNYLIDGAIRLIAYAIMGLWQWDTLLAFLRALPVAAVGLYVGGRVHAGFSPTTFVRLVSLLLLGSGLALLLK
jgi:uncharacterized protein